MRASWEPLAIGTGSITATLAGITAVHFLRRHAHERLPGRRAGSLALGLSTAGLALLAAHTVTAGLGAEHSAGVSLLAGLPALAGQALMALIVLRRRRR